MHAALMDVEGQEPEDSAKEIATKAGAMVVQANLSTLIAKALADQRAHFEKEWSHRENVLKQEQQGMQCGEKETGGTAPSGHGCHCANAVALMSGLKVF